MNTKFTRVALAVLPVLASSSWAQVGPDQNAAYVDNSVMVVYKKGATAEMKAAARNIVAAKVKDRNRNNTDDRYENILNGRLANFELGKGMSVKAAIAKLQSHPAVEYAEPNFLYSTAVDAAAVPDDARFDEQWGMHNTGQSGGTEDADIDAPEAWDITTGSRDIIIGVIDTGIDIDHPDLVDNLWTNPNEIAGNGIDDDNNGYVDDIHGINSITGSGNPDDDGDHGTHVSGTVGATGNNAIGVTGVSQQVSIAACKFLSGAGTGTTADAIECIDYFTALKNAGNNIMATNNSWGGGGFSQALKDSIEAGGDAGILFVAAAGNGNPGRDIDANPSYPAAYDSDVIMSIANTDRNDGLAGTSHFGAENVDMSAPGSAILSTWPGGGYQSISGTSMASPHVAGAAALVWSLNPELTWAEMKDLLMNSGDSISSIDGITVTGKRLNVKNALDLADPDPGFRMSVDPGSAQIVAGETASYTVDVISVADWEGAVALSLTSTIDGATLSANSANTGESVTVTVPTTEDTQWGDYALSVAGTATVDGESVEKSVNMGLNVLPAGLIDRTYENNTPVDIPDNDATGINSVINVADALTVFGTSAYVNITHTWSGDLTLTLTSPEGTTHTLRSRSGGSVDDIDESYETDVFNSEVATGDWTLNVSDNAGADTGTLNNWSLTITGIGEVLPSPPEAGFDFSTNFLEATFTDTSTDINDDITGWAWDFGDGGTSTDQNPTYTYSTDGTYDVTLTVTDSEGNSDSVTQSVDVANVDIAAELRRANRSRLGFLRVDIRWEGASTETVDIYRNGELYRTVSNTGRFRDFERRSTLDTYTYKVCQSENVCSNDVVVSFE